jgi:hypothetical protein
MYDQDLVMEIASQIHKATQTILKRFEAVRSPWEKAGRQGDAHEIIPFVGRPHQVADINSLDITFSRLKQVCIEYFGANSGS